MTTYKLSIFLLAFLVSHFCLGTSYHADPTEADQGVTGSGGTIKALVTNIGTDTATIILAHNSGTSTSYTFSTIAAIPSNITLKFESGAKLVINSGIFVNINGPIEANIRQIFAGSGDLNIAKDSAREFYAEWYGAIGNGRDDDYAAISQIISAMPDGAILKLLPKKYRIKSPLVVNKRISIRGTIPTEDQTAIIGATILKDGNFTALTLNTSSSNIFGLIVDGITGNGGNGIHLRGNSQTLTNVSVCEQGGVGITIGDATTTKNCNHWQLYHVTARNNGSHGIVIDDSDPGNGPDANGGFAHGLFCSGNGGDGLYVNRAQVNSFYGISNERNGGHGIHVGPANRSCTFFNPHSENNDGEEFLFDAGSTNSMLAGSMAYSAVDNGMNIVLGSVGGSNQRFKVSRRIVSGAGTSRPSSIGAGLGAESSYPGIYFWDTRAVVNERFWELFSHTGNLVLRASSDDGLTDADIIKFYRSGVGVYRINVRRGKLLVTDGIGVGNSVAGDVTTTAKTKKVQIFDVNGGSIGYIQVYQGP